MRYVCSDLHGQYDMFIKLLDLIEFCDDDIMYIIGDVVDRGTEPIKILKYIMQRDNIILIRGNHEEMMMVALDSKESLNGWMDMQLWFDNGGNITSEKLDAENLYTKNKIYDYLRRTPLYIDLGDYLLTHSGIQVSGVVNDVVTHKWDDVKQFQCIDDFLWTRKSFYNNRALDDRIVVFGHTPTVNIQDGYYGCIWTDLKYGDKIGIDCGLASRRDDKRLGCLNLDTLEETYVTLD